MGGRSRIAIHNGIIPPSRSALHCPLRLSSGPDHRDLSPVRFDPAVAGWFSDRFEAPTEPQAKGWPVIARGEDVLITAPTGSGKTLAAFLFALDRLTREARLGDLPDETRVVYVSR